MKITKCLAPRVPIRFGPSHPHRAGRRPKRAHRFRGLWTRRRAAIVSAQPPPPWSGEACSPVRGEKRAIPPGVPSAKSPIYPQPDVEPFERPCSGCRGGPARSRIDENTSGFRNRNSSVPSYQPCLFRASSDFDLRERIVLSGRWDLPLGRFVTLLPHRLTQGWSIYPIFSWRTGSPFDIFAPVNGFGAGNQYAYPGPSAAGDLGIIRANIVGPTGALDPRRSETLANPTIGVTATGNYYFSPASFSIAQCPDPSLGPSCMPSPSMFPSDSQAVTNPSVRTYGTLPRNFLRGPGQTNLDMSFAKATSLFHERVNLEIRADFFNILNHTEFANPITAATSQFFGQVINTYDPRIIQLAARLNF
jgi:hypothetical protein